MRGQAEQVKVDVPGRPDQFSTRLGREQVNVKGQGRAAQACMH